MPDELQLPKLSQRAVPGAGLVERAVVLTLACLLVLAGALLVGLFAVRLEVTVDGAGVLEPETVWPVRAESAGTVEDILITSGARVEAGELLARLDDFTISRELDRLRLEARNKRMTPETPRSELELLDQRIQTAEAQLARMQLVSPARARVLTEELDRLEGAHVTAGDVVLELASPGAWRASLLVSEHDIHLVRADDPVRVEIPAATTLDTWQARFPARVAFVGADPLVEPVGNGRYRVYANLETDRIDSDHLARFKRGMTAHAKVITRSARAIDLLVRHLTR